MMLQADVPYPSLDGIGEDLRTLRIISPAYAGREGELTAVLQYVYQAIYLGATGEEKSAKTLMSIAVAEMHHIELLGTLITKLGAPPVFASCPPYPVGFYSAACDLFVRAYALHDGKSPRRRGDRADHRGREGSSESASSDACGDERINSGINFQ